VRGYVFLCLPASYVVWLLERDLERFLYRDPDLDPLHLQDDPVLSTKMSDEGKRKRADMTVSGLPDEPRRPFKGLMAELGMLTENTLRTNRSGGFNPRGLASLPLERTERSVCCLRRSGAFPSPRGQK
jgi:hypothetical protein